MYFLIFVSIFVRLSWATTFPCTPSTSEFRFDTYSSVSKSTASLVPLTTGFISVWESPGQDGDSYGCYGQRFDIAGSKVGGEFRLNSYTPNQQNYPQVAGLSNGAYVAVWRSSGQDGNGYGVFCQHYRSDGSTLGGEIQVNSFTTSNQFDPKVVALSNGGYVVVWESTGQDSDLGGIYGQRFDASAAKQGSEFLINTVVVKDQSRPTLAVLANGNWVVIWKSAGGQDGSYDGVHGQVFTEAGTTVGSEFQVNSYTTNYQRYADVAALKAVGFVCVWESTTQDGDLGGIFFQLFDSSGTKAGSETRVNSYTTNEQNFPRVAALTTDGFVVVWISTNQDGDNNGVYSQLFTSSGTKVNLETRVNTYTASVQYNPRIATLLHGGYVVIWESHGQDGSNGGIYGQQYTSQGTAVASELKIHDYTTSYQFEPQVVPLTNNGFVALWGSAQGAFDGLFGKLYSCPIPTTAVPTDAPTPSPSTVTPTSVSSSPSPTTAAPSTTTASPTNTTLVTSTVDPGAGKAQSNTTTTENRVPPASTTAPGMEWWGYVVVIMTLLLLFLVITAVWFFLCRDKKKLPEEEQTKDPEEADAESFVAVEPNEDFQAFQDDEPPHEEGEIRVTRVVAWGFDEENPQPESGETEQQPQSSTLRRESSRPIETPNLFQRRASQETSQVVQRRASQETSQVFQRRPSQDTTQAVGQRPSSQQLQRGDSLRNGRPATKQDSRPQLLRPGTRDGQLPPSGRRETQDRSAFASPPDDSPQAKDSLKKQRKQLGKKVKAWKANFVQHFGFPPTKEDYLGDPEIAAVYEEYCNLPKDGDSPKRGQSPMPKDNEQSAASPLVDDKSRRKALNKQLKAWKTEFQSQYGREPTTKDISEDSTIAPIFKEFMELKKLEA